METNKLTIVDIIKRLKKATNTKTDESLSVLLGISKRNIETWKRRNSMDYEYILEYAISQNIDTNWLLTGEGEMLTNKAETTQTLKCPHCNKPLQITIG